MNIGEQSSGELKRGLYVNWHFSNEIELIQSVTLHLIGRRDTHTHTVDCNDRSARLSNDHTSMTSALF